MSDDNKIDPVVAKRWVGEIERKFDELASERGSYMATCKAIREQIGDLKEAAENAGLPKRTLNQILKERVLERKLEELRDIEDEDAADLAEQLRAALGEFGELPLGAAAVAAAQADDAKPKKGRKRKADGASAKSNTLDELNDDTDGDVRPRHLREADEARAAENAAKLNAGISELKH